MRRFTTFSAEGYPLAQVTVTVCIPELGLAQSLRMEGTRPQFIVAVAREFFRQNAPRYVKRDPHGDVLEYEM